MEQKGPRGYPSPARSLRDEAVNALNRGGMGQAYRIALEALRILGGTYWLADAVDDTNLAKLSAIHLHSEGRDERAVPILLAVLDSRLSMYEQKLQLAAGGIRCASCRSINPPGSNVCSRCGASLLPSEGEATIREVFRVCPSCHRTNTSGSAFCAYCGVPLS